MYRICIVYSIYSIVYSMYIQHNIVYSRKIYIMYVVQALGANSPPPRTAKIGPKEGGGKFSGGHGGFWGTAKSGTAIEGVGSNDHYL